MSIATRLYTIILSLLRLRLDACVAQIHLPALIYHLTYTNKDAGRIDNGLPAAMYSLVQILI